MPKVDTLLKVEGYYVRSNWRKAKEMKVLGRRATVNLLYARR